MADLFSKTPKFVVFLLAAGVLSGGISVMDSLYAQRKKEVKKENYNRPKPLQPIKPTIPGVDRFQDDKVFLENADSLFRPESALEERQIVKGNVVFRQGGMWMYCDSAYYFPQRNSLDAFGHVEMKQGDTLFVYSDKLYYDGANKHATLTTGPSRGEVTLKDPKVTLVTDSLDYDMNLELGWYTRGGKLSDDVNMLTSTYGEYSPATKLARFENEVVLDNTKDGYKMFTEELDYNTATHVASISTETRIEGASDTILTTSGRYNTVTDNAVLTSRSTIIHKDSADNIVTLEGDSIIYDKAGRISRAYMFRDPLRNPKPMVLTDTARKMTLVGGYGEYNDSIRRAYATEYPLLMEYSRPDTLFLRADTILSSIRTELVWPDSLSRCLSAETRRRLSSYNDPLDVARDFHLKLLLLPHGFPEAGTGIAASLLCGFPPGRFDMPSGRREASSPASASVGLSRLSGSGKHDGTDGVEIESGMPGANHVDVIPDSVPGDSAIADRKRSVVLPRRDTFGRDSAYMVPQEFHVARAIGSARFFRQDLQGIADTMIYQQYDSMLYLIRKPIVWSDNKQVYGDKINIHFNDTTVDRADLPTSGFLAEHIDEDFYNQLSGKEMTAYFDNETLKRLDVRGNVETIFLPMENDSTYNKLVNAESSFLTIEMTGNYLDKLKMWPETTATMTPVFMVKKSQQYLPGFKWFDILRPKREWYGGRWKWLDDLGEVPEELILYFKDDAPARKSTVVPSVDQLMADPPTKVEAVQPLKEDAPRISLN